MRVAQSTASFPRTRYQGSKRKLAKSIIRATSRFESSNVLDAFGGTAAVAHAFKREGKAVTYNDVLRFNEQIGIALIENDGVRLTEDEIAAVGERQAGVEYGDVVERHFEGIYFTAAENRWLDVAIGNIRRLACRYKRAIAWYALFQAAMAKRPYNLFHRANLYMRTAKVPRSFGNKASWDRCFAEHFTKFAREANDAVFAGAAPSRATCLDALEVEQGYDLVYIDTPYVNKSGVGVAYREFYHFLEGIMRYDQWPALIDYRSKHRRLLPHRDDWADPATSPLLFQQLFNRFRNSVLAVSYRSNGTPSVDELVAMLQSVKRRVEVLDLSEYQYALSTDRTSREVLLLGLD